MNLHRREDFLTYSSVFLLIMLLITMLLAAVAGLQPLRQIHFTAVDFAIGTGAALVMMLAFGFASSVRHQAEDILGRSLAACRWYDLIILACLVGLIEELLFRGVLEPWVARYDPVVAFISVNAFFGVLHAVSPGYAIVAGLLGAILSLLAHSVGEFNLLRPIVAHAVYDYIGFVWIARSFRRRNLKSSPSNLESEANSKSE